MRIHGRDNLVVVIYDCSHLFPGRYARPEL